jgi:hypothetical protein
MFMYHCAMNADTAPTNAPGAFYPLADRISGFTIIGLERSLRRVAPDVWELVGFQELNDGACQANGEIVRCPPATKVLGRLHVVPGMHVEERQLDRDYGDKVNGECPYEQ